MIIKKDCQQGEAYVRNGSVIDPKINSEEIKAIIVLYGGPLFLCAVCYYVCAVSLEFMPFLRVVGETTFGHRRLFALKGTYGSPALILPLRGERLFHLHV